MMISPNQYIQQIKEDGLDYYELIQERNRLIEFITTFETENIQGIDNNAQTYVVSPSPEVRYQMYMSYLAELFSFMRQTYNEEYVWGEKELTEFKGSKGYD